MLEHCTFVIPGGNELEVARVGFEPVHSLVNQFGEVPVDVELSPDSALGHAPVVAAAHPINQITEVEHHGVALHRLLKVAFLHGAVTVGAVPVPVTAEEEPVFEAGLDVGEGEDESAVITDARSVFVQLIGAKTARRENTMPPVTRRVRRKFSNLILARTPVINSAWSLTFRTTPGSPVLGLVNM